MKVISSILIVCVLLARPALAEQMVIVHNDFGEAIKSEISILGQINKTLGYTNANGILELKKKCEHGELIKAKPIYDPTYYNETVDCKPDKKKIPIKVTQKHFITNLDTNAERLGNKGQKGNAALAYTELAYRISSEDIQAAERARKRAYLAFADAINTPEDIEIIKYDKTQDSYVLTPKFVNYLKEYQKNKGVPVTGNLDFKTLSTQSNISVIELLSKTPE